jgi:hypothetical protein
MITKKKVCSTEETGLLMSSWYIEINALYAGRGHGGGGGECKGRRGSWLRAWDLSGWEIRHMKKGLPSQVSGFLFFP